MFLSSTGFLHLGNLTSHPIISRLFTTSLFCNAKKREKIKNKTASEPSASLKQEGWEQRGSETRLEDRTRKSGGNRGCSETIESKLF